MSLKVEDYIGDIKDEIFYINDDGQPILKIDANGISTYRMKIRNDLNSQLIQNADVEYFPEKDYQFNIDTLFSGCINDENSSKVINIDSRIVDIDENFADCFRRSSINKISKVIIKNSIIIKLPVDSTDYADIELNFGNCIIFDYSKKFTRVKFKNSIILIDEIKSTTINLFNSISLSNIDCKEITVYRSFLASQDLNSSESCLLQSSIAFVNNTNTDKLQIYKSIIHLSSILAYSTWINNSKIISDFEIRGKIGQQNELKIDQSEVEKILSIGTNDIQIALIDNERIDSIVFLDKKYSKPISIFKCKFHHFKATGTTFEMLDFMSSEIKTCDRLTALKLKNISLQRNNRIEALYFHGCESDAYIEEIKKSSGNWLREFYDSLRHKSNIKNYLHDLLFYAKKGLVKYRELLPLWFNKWTNCYGRSWVRPLLIILGLGLLAFNIFDESLKTESFEWNYSFDCSVFYDYLQFLNPAHAPDFMQKNEPSGFARIIETIFRLISGYLYFQIVQAFRKYKIYE